LGAQAAAQRMPALYYALSLDSWRSMFMNLNVKRVLSSVHKMNYSWTVNIFPWILQDFYLVNLVHYCIYVIHNTYYEKIQHIKTALERNNH
jgi:hypothetical protein